MGRKRKRTITGKIITIFLLTLLILVVAAGLFVSLVKTGEEPVVEDMSALGVKRERYGDNTYIAGNNWLRKSESGIWECYIEGSAFERGAVFGILTKELLYYQELAFVEQIKELIPSESYLKILRKFIAFFNRNLEENITDEYRQEIYGTSFSSDTSFEFIGTGYQRQLNYHAAHDIAHALNDFNMVGCTSFSVWDGESVDSAIITGRNFDFYVGDKFAENKIVCFVNPDQGYRFAMVTWADMIGVVSGMNEKGLTVTLNAAKSSIPFKSSTPVTLLAREILQYASDIEEAWEISEKRDLFVSESIMISSASDGMTAIIEKAPGKSGLVYPREDRIICANHFQGEVFADDKRNIDNINESDSRPRYLRVEELLDRTGKVDELAAATVLRNRQGLGNTEIGMGNELAVNQLIAHHSVIFKPDSLLMWVSESPYQLGRYIAYDLKKVFETEISSIKNNDEIYSADRIIPADTFLYSEDYMDFQKYRTMSRELAKMTDDGTQIPESFINEYTGTNPDFYLTYVHIGDYYRNSGESGTALAFYEKALTLAIPKVHEKENIQKLTDEMKSHK